MQRFSSSIVICDLADRTTQGCCLNKFAVRGLKGVVFLRSTCLRTAGRFDDGHFETFPSSQLSSNENGPRGHVTFAMRCTCCVPPCHALSTFVGIKRSYCGLETVCSARWGEVRSAAVRTQTLRPAVRRSRFLLVAWYGAVTDL